LEFGGIGGIIVEANPLRLPHDRADKNRMAQSNSTGRQLDVRDGERGLSHDSNIAVLFGAPASFGPSNLHRILRCLLLRLAVGLLRTARRIGKEATHYQPGTTQEKEGVLQ
jgi:hypothetical protein